MPREVERAYGCFRCGAMLPLFVTDDLGRHVCDECGERGVVTFKQALDMINELHVTGYEAEVAEAMEYDTYDIEVEDVPNE